jgi:hypothetical protein
MSSSHRRASRSVFHPWMSFGSDQDLRNREAHFQREEDSETKLGIRDIMQNFPTSLTS